MAKMDSLQGNREDRLLYNTVHPTTSLRAFLSPIRWIQRDLASWHGDLDDRLVVNVVRLGPETICQVALWTIRGGLNKLRICHFVEW